MPEKELNKRLDRLESRITGAQDIEEIKNLLYRYLFYLENSDVEKIASCFALEDPDVFLETGRGRFQGKEQILTFYNQRVEIGRLPGAMVEHGAGAPAIVCAKDRKTARATFLSPGFKCLPQGDSQAWDMGRYYAELRATTEGWKIWHLQWIVAVEGDAAYGWLTQNRSYLKECDYPLLDELGKEEEALTPSSFYADYYKPDEKNRFLPEPPEPYETYDGYQVLKDTRGY